MKKNLIILEVIIVCTLVKGLILFLSFCFLLDTASVASIALSSYPSQISIGKKQKKEGKVRVQFMLAYQQYYCSLVNSLSTTPFGFIGPGGTWRWGERGRPDQCLGSLLYTDLHKC